MTDRGETRRRPVSARSPASGRSDSAVRVVLLGLDGFPHRAVSAERTPSLWRLASEGGRAPDGGRPPLPSTTYPGFASLLTGALPERHEVRTTAHRKGAVPGWAGRRRVALPTLLDACLVAGVAARVVLGDHKLHRVLRVPAGIPAWPSGGEVPPGTRVDGHGYPTNEAVRPHLLEAASDAAARFLFAHLNEADTFGHDLGPDGPDSVSCQRATDEVIADFVEALRPAWARTVVVVVSDHDMDARATARPIDPLSAPGIDGTIRDWIGDGEAAWIRLAEGADAMAVRSAIEALDGVAEARPVRPDRLLALAAPGRVFVGDEHPGGVHGGPGTERTVAIVGGGHASVPALAAAIAHRPPHLADWAPTLASLLGVVLVDADGLDLLEEVASGGT